MHVAVPHAHKRNEAIPPPYTYAHPQCGAYWPTGRGSAVAVPRAMACSGVANCQLLMSLRKT